MTAEVVVLNKSAVALAADSAVTIVVDGVPKPYQADKLFVLKDDAPVGMMFYGNAEFMGIPWETLVGMYRHASRPRRRSSIRSYAVDFLRFIKEAVARDADAELDNAMRIAMDAIHASRRHVEDETLEVLKGMDADERRLTNRERNALFKRCLEARVDRLRRVRRFHTTDGAKLSAVVAACWDRVAPHIDHIFSGFRVTRVTRGLLRSTVRLSLERRVRVETGSSISHH